MSDDEPKLTPSALGSQMRGIPSAKRDAAILRNLATARAVYRTSHPPAACTCRVVRADGTHESGCIVYKRQKQRESRERQKQKAAAV